MEVPPSTMWERRTLQRQIHETILFPSRILDFHVDVIDSKQQHMLSVLIG